MRKQYSSYVGLAILFVGSFVGLHWIYGYVIAFRSETSDCFFMFGRSFLVEFLGRPGDLLRYSGRFLSQFYHYQWLGALVVSASIACFGVLFHRVLVKLNGTASVLETLLPCLLLFALHTSTIYDLYDTVGSCASCGAFLGYLSLRGKAARWAYAPVATPVLYLLVGAYTWLFVAWVVVLTPVRKAGHGPGAHATTGPPGRPLAWVGVSLRLDVVLKVLYLVFSITVPLVAWRWVFSIPLRSAFACPIMLGPPCRAGSPPYAVGHVVTDLLLMVAFFASLLVIPSWSRFSCGARLATYWRAIPRRRRCTALAVAIPVLALTFHFTRYDAGLESLVACRRLYMHERWDSLLAEVKGRTSLDLDTQLMTNFALYKKGKLLDEMFQYPQLWGPRGLISNISGTGGLSPEEEDRHRAMYNCDHFYEMGHVNFAFLHAYNSLSALGQTNDGLKRMARCSMANGNNEMADKYLNMLERTLFGSEYARRYKAIIADSEAAQREFGVVRRRYPVVDVPGWEHPGMYLTALSVDKDNSMAVDYLTAWLLLEKSKDSLGAICDNVEMFKTAGYVSIPRHCQEMLLLWERQEGTSVDLRGYRYDERIAARVDQFLWDLSREEDVEDAAEHLRSRYGDTYMFYCFCVPTPAEARWRLRMQTGSGVSRREE